MEIFHGHYLQVKWQFNVYRMAQNFSGVKLRRIDALYISVSKNNLANLLPCMYVYGRLNDRFGGVNIA